MKALYKLVFILLLTSMLVSCIGTGGEEFTPRSQSAELYRAYSGTDKSPEEISTILMKGSRTEISDYIDWVVIQETQVDHGDFGKIQIIPGSYMIKWGRKFNVSGMIKRSGAENRSWSTDIIVEPGHTYTIHAARTIGQGYIIYSWITDDTLNKTIWGKEFIPGPYYHLRQ